MITKAVAAIIEQAVLFSLQIRGRHIVGYSFIY